MATVIDALLVTLGLDASGYKSGTADVERQQSKLSKLMQKDAKERTALDKKAEHAQKKRADAFEKQGKHAAETFGKIRDHALGLIAVLAGGVGMVEFGKDAIKGSADLGRLSHNLGIHIKTLQGWEYANKSVGGSAKAMAATLEGLTESVQGYLHGGGAPTAQMDAMTKYGVGVHKTALGQLKAASKHLSEVYHSGAADAHQTAWMEAQQMGLGSVFNLIKHNAEMYRRVAEGEKLSTYTRSFANQSEAMQLWWATFTTKLKDVAVQIFTAFLPAINQLQSKMMGWANWAASHQTQIVGWVTKFVDGLITLGAEINKAVQWLGGWKDLLVALVGLKVLSMVSPLLALAGALGKVAGGLTGISESSGGLMILKALGKAGLLGAAGGIGYAIGKYAVNPALNKGVKWATGGADTSFGEWLFKSTHTDPNYYKDLRKEHDNLIPISHNNPGDLRQWGNNPVKNGFAQFSSPAAGLTAMAENLKAYQRQGKDTLTKIISTWAPSSDGNNTKAYINMTARRMGVNPNAPLNLNDPKTLALLMAAISEQEAGGKYYSPATIRSVAQVVAQGRPPGHVGAKASAPVPPQKPSVLTQIVKHVGAKASAPVPPQKPSVLTQIVKHVGAKASAPVRSASIVNHNTHSNEAHIGSVVVNTNATDPAAHGRLVSGAIHRYLYTDALNSGIV